MLSVAVAKQSAADGAEGAVFLIQKHTGDGCNSLNVQWARGFSSSPWVGACERTGGGVSGRHSLGGGLQFGALDREPHPYLYTPTTTAWSLS